MITILCCFRGLDFKYSSSSPYPQLAYLTPTYSNLSYLLPLKWPGRGLDLSFEYAYNIRCCYLCHICLQSCYSIISQRWIIKSLETPNIRLRHSLSSETSSQRPFVFLYQARHRQLFKVAAFSYPVYHVTIICCMPLQDVYVFVAVVDKFVFT